MADCEAPSFSLGLDLLFDSEPQIPADPINPEPQCGDEEDGDSGSHVVDSDPETRTDLPRVLRRLRRGLPQPRETTPLRRSDFDVDDEIEEFGSQEDFFEELRSPAQYHSMCSSSKIPLHGCGVIAKSSSERKAKKNEPASTLTAAAGTERSCNEKFIAKLTASPLRRFQLIDSDSELDSPSTSDEAIITDIRTNQASENLGVSATTTEQLRKRSDCKPRGEDLWKDFCPTKSFHVLTPALDEMCKEYFGSGKDKRALENLQSYAFGKSSSNFMGTTNGQSIEDSWNEAKPLFPSHRYFLHHDPRIRKLVRDRLPNFFPLGIDNDVRSQQNGASTVDYMGQFGNKEPSKRQATQQVDLEKSSKRGRNAMNIEQGKATQSSAAKKSSRNYSKKSAGEASQSWVNPKQGKGQRSTARKTSKKGRSAQQASSTGEGLNDSGSWVNPRSSTNITSDSANTGSYSNGQSAGQWYTGANGRKVYVNKNGEELTGQMAYRQYKRDKGGFGKGERKNSSKKKKA